MGFFHNSQNNMISTMLLKLINWLIKIHMQVPPGGSLMKN